MSFWDWFTTSVLASPMFWWIAIIALSAMSGVTFPFVRQFRLWQSKRRFMAAQASRLSNPQNADVRYQLANLYADAGSWRRAEEHARDAVRVAGENPLYEGQIPYHFLVLLGEALYHRRSYEEAAETYRKALAAKAERGYADARFGLGLALFRNGETEKAIEAYRLAIEENQSMLELYFRLAQAAALLGRDAEVDRAQDEFRRVAASLPRFAGRHRLRWRVAFFLFPMMRHLV